MKKSLFMLGVIISGSLLSAKSGIAAQHFEFSNALSNKCLEVGGSKNSNGANVNIWECDGGEAQQWELKSIVRDYYVMINRHSGKAMEVGGSKTNNGANVNIWEYDGGR